VHAAPADRCASAAQLALAPSQVSTRSHSVTAARHVTPLPFTRLTQAPVPLHVSCASHPVAFDEPQLTPSGANASLGQLTVLPSQTSAGSQVGSAPAALQITPALFTRSTQLPAELHVSCASQPVALEEPQLVPEGAMVSRGHAAETPSQSSAGLHVALGPAGRQTTPTDFTRSMHAPAPLHVSWASHAVALDDPHVVPSAFGEAALSVQTGAPLPQTMMPVAHALGLVVHTVPALQGVHAPVPLHTPPAQAAPGNRGEDGLSAQTATPVPHWMVPS
jgi:hypothetical protein